MDTSSATRTRTPDAGECGGGERSAIEASGMT